MISIARKRLPHISFKVSKISDISGYQFQNITSLFHVLNYHTTDEDLTHFLESGFRNLVLDGIFCFDFWNIAGVKREPPTSRVVKMEKNDIKISRRSTPVLIGDDLIKVKFHFQISGSHQKSFREEHLLRAYDKDLIYKVAKKIGFKKIEFYTWLTDKPLNDAWYGYCVCEK